MFELVVTAIFFLSVGLWLIWNLAYTNLVAGVCALILFVAYLIQLLW